MHFHVLTLFPEQVDAFLRTSIIGRALDSGVIRLSTVQIRDYTPDKHRKVDDTLFGGGTGMLMTCEPVYQAWKSVVPEDKRDDSYHTIFLSPKGGVLTQSKAAELAGRENLVFLCGHYEGIDQRVLDEIVDEELSIGDYVLTGGEVASCVAIDCISRLIDGVLPDQSAYEEESHMAGILEAPQYTKPAVWHDKGVPEILLSGHHAKIVEWKRLQSLYETWKKRPDMFAELACSREDWEILLEWDAERKSLGEED